MGQGGGEPGTSLCEQGKAQGFELHCISIANKLVIAEMNIFSLTRTLVVLGRDFFSSVLFKNFFEMPA